MTDLLAGGPLAFTCGFCGACDEPARGDERLHPWEAVDLMDFIPQHKGQDLADTRDRAQPIAGLCPVRRGGLDEIQLQAGQQAIVGGDQREVHCEARLDGRLGKPFGHTGSVGLVRELLMDLRPIVLTVGMGNMGQELSPFAHEMSPAPKPVAHGPHLGGINVGLGQHSAPPEHRDLVGIDLLILRLAPMDGLHGEGMAPDEGNPLLGAEGS
jgi:hypothetical protein